VIIGVLAACTPAQVAARLRARRGPGGATNPVHPVMVTTRARWQVILPGDYREMHCGWSVLLHTEPVIGWLRDPWRWIVRSLRRTEARAPPRLLNVWRMVVTLAFVVAVLSAAVWTVTALLSRGTEKITDHAERVQVRNDATRTGLAAAAAVGAAATLLLTFRRQRYTGHSDRENRVTELYTKVVEQLGNCCACSISPPTTSPASAAAWHAALFALAQRSFGQHHVR
jgi:hypothetical protein